MFVDAAAAAMTKSMPATGPTPSRNPSEPTDTPITADAPIRNHPRRLIFHTPARRAPPRPPAASADTAKPYAVGDANRVLAIYARPTLIGPLTQMFSMAASPIRDVKAASRRTYAIPSRIDFHIGDRAGAWGRGGSGR